jgi:hypothetical protein
MNNTEHIWQHAIAEMCEELKQDLAAYQAAHPDEDRSTALENWTIRRLAMLDYIAAADNGEQRRLVVKALVA